MKSFQLWLNEITNSSAGTGVRGFGDVSGNPGGNLNAYAAQNAIAVPVAQDMVNQHNSLHSIQVNTNSDTKDNILRSKRVKR